MHKILNLFLSPLILICLITSCQNKVPSDKIETKPAQKQISWFPEYAWPGFRGPGGNGIAPTGKYPQFFNVETGKNILWKTPFAISGASSPIIWKDRIFISGANETTREVYCFSLDSGKVLWKKEVKGDPTKEAPQVFEEYGYAACTPVTDGKYLIVFFASGDLECLDFEGKLLWKKNFTITENEYGHASSPVLSGNLIILQLDQGGGEEQKSRLIALDKKDGKLVWETSRLAPNTWSTPLIFKFGNTTQVVCCGDPWINSYDIKTGAEIWKAEGLAGEIAPSPVFGSGIVISAQSGAYLMAIRPDGKGDVTKTHINFKVDEGLPEISSPLYSNGLIYLLQEMGTLTLVDGKSGKKIWELELDEEFLGSPSLAGDHIYIPSKTGKVFILKSGRDKPTIFSCSIGEEINSSPAFTKNRLIIRGVNNLFCIGSKSP